MDIALIIGIPVVIILAAVTVLASARRRSSDAQGRVTGKLGGETKASDSSALAVTDDTSEEARARAERSAELVRGHAHCRASTGGEVDGNVPDGLDGVGVDRNAGCSS